MLIKTLQLVREFRKDDNCAPIMMVGTTRSISTVSTASSVQGAQELLRIRTLRVDGRHHWPVLVDNSKIAKAVKYIKAHTDLPVCVGFVIQTVEQVSTIGTAADNSVVGTAIVNTVAHVIDSQSKKTVDPVEAIALLGAVTTLVNSVSQEFAPHALLLPNKYPMS